MVQLATLLLQIVVILAAIRAAGWVCRRCRQPQVVGEMVAGIVLGPSVLGWVMPGLSSFVFPERSLPFLNALSQVGLAELAGLRRTLLVWLATADTTGLDEDGIVALFTSALRDFHERRGAARTRGGAASSETEAVA